MLSQATFRREWPRDVSKRRNAARALHLAAEHQYGKPKPLVAARLFSDLGANIAEARCITETVASGAALVQKRTSPADQSVDSSVNFVIVGRSAWHVFYRLNSKVRRP
jgi:hypothetical protein